MRAERHAHAMGAEVNIVVTADDLVCGSGRQAPTAGQVADAALARIDDPDSEISRLNTSEGRPTVVSDDTCHLIDSAVAAGICVDLGGDVRVAGRAPRANGWTISVDHPDERLALLGLHDGAVATSTTLRRRWQVGGHPRHHLIDPRTGRPSTSDIAFVTVVAEGALRAETMAKAILLRGGEHPFDLLDGNGMEALVSYHDGRVRWSEGFTRFTGTHEPPSSIGDRAPIDSAGPGPTSLERVAR